MRALWRFLALVGLLAACGGTGQAGIIVNPFITHPTPSATLIADFAATRTASCISPCYVQFDAVDPTTGTDSTLTTQEFHEVDYHWNFGDSGTSGTGTWDYGAFAGASLRNEARGPLAGHVFECASGSTCVYTVTLTARYSGTTATKQRTITVTDPEAATEFDGAETVCYENAPASWTGCPAGATQVETSDLNQLQTQIAAGRNRHLFNRGDTFSTDNSVYVCNNGTNVGLGCVTAATNSGPGLIGAYGTGAKPKFQASAAFPTGAGAGILRVSGHYGRNMTDWRLQDIELDGSLTTIPGYIAGIQAYGGLSRMTILRVTSSAITIGIAAGSDTLNSHNNSGGASTMGHSLWSEWAIVDHDITNVPHGNPASTPTFQYGLFISFDRSAVLGVNLDGGAGADNIAGISHRIRLQCGAKVIIADSDLKRPSGTGAHVLKVQSGDWVEDPSDPTDPYARTEPVGVCGNGDPEAGIGMGLGGGYTRWLVVANNKIESNYSPYPVSFGPQSGCTTTPPTQNRVRDVLFERNWVVMTQNAGSGTRILNYEGTYGTIRNNLFDLSVTAAGGRHGPYVGKRTPAGTCEIAADNVALYGNTINSGAGATGAIGIKIETGSTNITAKNNLMYAPADGTAAMFALQAADTSCGNSGQVSTVGTNPVFAGALSAIGGWALGGGSPYDGTGCAMPVWRAFDGALRSTTTPSVGAYE